MGAALRRLPLARTLIALAVAVLMLAALPAFAQFFEPDDDDQPLQRGRSGALRWKNIGAVLDDVLPETAVPKPLPVSEKLVRQWIGELDSNVYRTRESAMKRLLEIGPAGEPLLREALKSDSAEVAWRAAEVLRQWEGRKFEERAWVIEPFSEYCAKVRDDVRLKELARRTRQALELGLWGETRREVLTLCIATLARAPDEKHLDSLRPLLEHNNAEVAILVADAATNAATDQFPSARRSLPKLVLEALRSRRDEVALAVLNHFHGAQQSFHDADLRRALLAVFGGGNDNMRLFAARPLVWFYRQPEALDYLLEQAKSEDLSRRYMALSGLALPETKPAPPDAKLLEAMKPLLKSKDQQTRRSAAEVLASYSGAAVIELLIPLLGDKETAVSEDVGNRLLNQPDKALLRKHLQEAAGDKSTRVMRLQAKRLLDVLDKGDDAGPAKKAVPEDAIDAADLFGR